MPKRNLIWIAAILLAAVATMWVTRRQFPRISGNGWGGDPSPLAQADQLIHDNWAGRINEEAMYRAALAAMAYTLDEHSSYMPPETMRALSRQLEGTAYGFGLVIGECDSGVEIVAPQFDSPAHRAGILPGDVIAAIDGVPALVALPESWIVGNDGQPRTSVTFVRACGTRSDNDERIELTILRNGVQLAPITLKMGEFAIETVSGLGRDENGQWVYAVDETDGVAYVRISEFANSRTADDLQRVMRELTHTRKLILDLRDNPGGPLDAAVNIADMFLQDGPIVTQLFPNAQPREYIASGGNTYYPDIAMVVLVNSGTASAAEIVAGALAHNGRAVLLGEGTRGKRAIQEMFPLPGGLGQLNLSTSGYAFRRARENERLEPEQIDDQPIAPQVPVCADPDHVRELRRLRLIAALGPHLKAAHRLGEPCPPALEQDPHTLVQELIYLDVQLTEAIDLLNSPQRMKAILRQARLRRLNAAEAGEAPR